MERSRRLREPHDIRRVRSKGRSYPEGPVVVRVLPNRIDPPANRYTVIAGKKQGGSVQRNRVKRLLREALRHVDPTLAPGLDLLVLVRGRAEDIPDYAAARAIVDRVIARAGIAKTAPTTPSSPAPSARPASPASPATPATPAPSVIPTKEGSRPATTPTETPRASG